MAFGKLHILVLLCLSIIVTGCSARKKVEPVEVPSGMISDEMSNVAHLKPRQGTGPVKITSTKGRENEAYCTIAMVKPADGPVNSPYGVRRIPGKKRGKKFHKGIDIGAKRGSDVVAAASGKVIFSGKKRGYGNTVEIEHGNGFVTLYAHLDKIFVSEGQAVSEAGRIGVVGRTGRTTGPNLHFELLAGGKPVNPIPTQGWKRDTMPGAGGWRGMFPTTFVNGAELTALAREVRQETFVRGAASGALANRAKPEAFMSGIHPDTFVNGAKLAVFARGTKQKTLAREKKSDAYVSEAKSAAFVSDVKPDAFAGEVEQVALVSAGKAGSLMRGGS